MENKLNLYQKLLEIQKEVIGLGKNKKSGTYDYVTGSKVLEHIKPLMNKLGIILKQEVLSIDNQKMDYVVGFGTPKERTKSEILSKLIMRFTWIDCESGEKDENLFGANGQNDWDKGVGSALTYGERYFLLKFFHIATDEDDIDNPERKAQEEEQRQQAQKDLERETERWKASIISKLEACTTEEALTKEFMQIPKDWQPFFKQTATNKKESLTQK